MNKSENVTRKAGGGLAASGDSADSWSIAKAARLQRLNQGLLTLAEWCKSRAANEHDDETTLTILERKAKELREAVLKASIKAHAEFNPPNAPHQTTPNPK